MEKLVSGPSLQFWHERSVLVTGATGIVGSWLVKDLLTQGAQVVALVRDPDPQSEFYRSEDYKSVSIVQGYLEDFWTLERTISQYEVKTVFHLAAQPIVGVAQRSPLPTFEANIRGTYNLLEACRLHPQLIEEVVVASSDKAYGTQPNLPYTEDMPLQGIYPYEVSKSCADLITQTYYHTYGLPVAIARCGNIFGGGDLNWSRIVPGTIRTLLAGQRPIIRSDGSYIRDYIYVKDVSQAYIKVAEGLHQQPQVRGQAFNFSPEQAVTVLELVNHIRRLMNCEHVELDIRNTAQGEIHSQYLSADKAHQILGWRPQYNLDESLTETIKWYQHFLAEE